MGEPLLKGEGIYVGYDRADVLEDLSLEVAEGTITCLLGSNGSGKTALIRAILGLTKPRLGRVFFAGQDITGLATHHIVQLGLASIPEGRKVFPAMTVADNLRLGDYQENSPAVLRSRLERVYTVFPRLAERAGQLAGTMSGDEQAMVSIGRGLMIVDEPSLGLYQPGGRHRLPGGAERAPDPGHIPHHGYVLAKGRVAASGEAQALAHDPEVRQAYFG